MVPKTDAVDRSIAAAGDRFATILRTERLPRQNGFLQSVDPAVKVLGLPVLVGLAATRTNPLAALGLLALAAALAVQSAVPLALLGKRVGVVAGFAAIVVAPQAVLMRGATVPGPVPLSVAGSEYVVTVVIRVAASAAFAMLLPLTTRFADVLEALRRLHAPAVAVTLLAITYRYLAMLLTELARFLRTRRSRRIVDPKLRDGWRRGGATVGAFLIRTIERGERVQRAARARGGTGMAAYPRSTALSAPDVVFSGIVTAMAAVVILG